MKNMVFTVIAILLLLATVLPAMAERYTEEFDFTVNNYEDTDVFVSYAVYQWDYPSYRVQGWYKIEPGNSKRFTAPSYVGNYGRGFHLRMERNGEEIIPHDANRETVFHRRSVNLRSAEELLYHPHEVHDIRGWDWETRTQNVEMDIEEAFAYWVERLPRHPLFVTHFISFDELVDSIAKFGADRTSKALAQPLYFRDAGGAVPDLERIIVAIAQGEDTVSLENYIGEFPVPREGSSPTEGLEMGRYWSYGRFEADYYYDIGSRSDSYITHSVTIDGLPLDPRKRWDNGGSPLPPVPNLGGNKFIILSQYGNTCGPTSLEMVLHYYGERATMEDIWRAGDIDTVAWGTWPGEMKLALNELGVPAHLYDEDTEGYRNDPFERLRRYVDGNRPPCILIRYLDEEGDIAYHWVVVVGYRYLSDGKIDEYLLADPHGKFRWENREDLDKFWGFKHIQDSPGSRIINRANYWEGGFDPVDFWTDAAVDLATDPYTAIVPRSAPTKHPKNYRTEYGPNGETDEERSGPRGYYKVKGEAKVAAGLLNFLTFGLVGKEATRDWSETIYFDEPFDFYTVSAIKLFSWGGGANLKGHERVGDLGVKIWGRVEDGALIRGELDVMVRPYFDTDKDRSRIISELIEAPSLGVSARLETSLLPNYPNPFNPETWIPYQLSEPAEVTVSVYSVDGTLVRRLSLGWMPSGVYRSRSRAAYWDGRNASGESVASGVYFYTLRAGDFSATRKLVIRK